MLGGCEKMGLYVILSDKGVYSAINEYENLMGRAKVLCREGKRGDVQGERAYEYVCLYSAIKGYEKSRVGRA